ncbi:unnamed protein product, partial [Phaeothamnion confervicola]
MENRAKGLGVGKGTGSVLAKTLNPEAATGGNRFKFQTKRQRVWAVDVDVVHRVRGDGFLDPDAAAVPASGEGGCFFQDELERCMELNATPPFKRFYYRVWPLVQSLPELLHRAATVLGMLLDMLSDRKTCAAAGEELLQLVAIMARDLRAEFYPFFPRAMDVLLRLLADNADDPEVAGKIFRTVGYLLKFVGPQLLASLDDLRPYYAPLLGYRGDHVRAFAAETLAALLRRLPPKPLRRYVRSLLRALATGGAGPVATSAAMVVVVPEAEAEAAAEAAAGADADAENDADGDVDTGGGGVRSPAAASGFFAVRGGGGGSGGESSGGGDRDRSGGVAAAGAGHTTQARRDMIDGCARLLFCMVKGIQGRVHSRAPQLLRVLFESLLVPKPTSIPVGEADDGGHGANGHTKRCSSSERRSDADGMTAAARGAAEEAGREWCFAVTARMMTLLCHHLRAPHSADVWMEIQFCLGTASARCKAYATAAAAAAAASSPIITAAYGGVDVAANAVVPKTTEPTGSTAVSSASAKAAAGPAKEAGAAVPTAGVAVAATVAAERAAGVAAEFASLRRAFTLVALAVEHAGGILLRDPPVAKKQVALLAQAIEGQ